MEVEEGATVDAAVVGGATSGARTAGGEGISIVSAEGEEVAGGLGTRSSLK